MISKERIVRNLINIPGWSTPRHVIVIESDDWGMIRTASKASYNRLLRKGYPVEKCIYNRLDRIESKKDIEGLLEVLSSVRGSDGKPAKFTMNNVVANPDFRKIKEGDFKTYFFEPFTDTLERTPGSEGVMKLYHEGLKTNLFQVQFHGREHINVNRWIGALENKDRRFMDAFSEDMFSVPAEENNSGRKDYLDAFGMGYQKEYEETEKIITSGVQLFKKIWNFSPKSFIAPCYTWHPLIEKILNENGIQYLQGTHVQRVPKSGNTLEIIRKYHFQGQKNTLGQRYLVRNVVFEPAEGLKTDPVNEALKQIETAFKFQKPAILSSHRVNYSGSLVPKNRSENLFLLQNLLREIVKKFPQVEFMSSDELGYLMDKE